MDYIKNNKRMAAALSIAAAITICSANFTVFAGNEPLMPETAMEDLVLEGSTAVQKTDTVAEPKTEVKAEANTEVKAEVKAEVKTEVKTTSTVTAEAKPPEITYYFTADRVNFRKQPSTSAEIIKTLDSGVKVQFLGYVTAGGEKDGWGEVIYNETRGYIKSEYISSDIKAVSGQKTVQLLEWSEVKKIFTLGTPAEVYDVRTGITYYVKSFSNGLHADVEPATTDDTAALKKTFGNKWDWTPRPVWVTINGYTIAASINGMPHGGGVIDGNGMDGQVCLHFRGSTTHNGNTKFANDHQKAITEAWNAVKN